MVGGEARLDPREVEVSELVLSMSMSLDGDIAGQKDEPGNPGGDGFDRLHEGHNRGRGALWAELGGCGPVYVTNPPSGESADPSAENPSRGCSA
jgi:hypothetical protein